jgi:cis-L-3-hydroxyproline dehydratase
MKMPNISLLYSPINSLGSFFLVDANGGMTVENALRMLRLLPDGLDFVLEAPCATWREIVSLC